jgi:hypothetical protein
MGTSLIPADGEVWRIRRGAIEKLQTGSAKGLNAMRRRCLLAF